MIIHVSGQAPIFKVTSYYSFQNNTWCEYNWLRERIFNRTFRKISEKNIKFKWKHEEAIYAI